MAGYIPGIQKFTKYITIFIVLFHCTQSTVRIVLNHDMVLNTWYLFDASGTPAYEIANFVQVMLKFLNLLHVVLSVFLRRNVDIINMNEIMTIYSNNWDYI
jgi:hypothetical protein